MSTEIAETVDAADSVESPNDFAMVRPGEKFAVDVWHNFKGDGRSVWELATAATGPDCKDIREHLDKVINLKHYFGHRATINGKTPGEVVDVIRVVLLDADGQAYASVSDGVRIGLQLMIKCIGAGPWEPPEPVKVVQIETRGGNRYFKLVPANIKSTK